jgi:hypothetical protein
MIKKFLICLILFVILLTPLINAQETLGSFLKTAGDNFDKFWGEISDKTSSAYDKYFIKPIKNKILFALGIQTSEGEQASVISEEFNFIAFLTWIAFGLVIGLIYTFFMEKNKNRGKLTYIKFSTLTKTGLILGGGLLSGVIYILMTTGGYIYFTTQAFIDSLWFFGLFSIWLTIFYIIHLISSGYIKSILNYPRYRSYNFQRKNIPSYQSSKVHYFEWTAPIFAFAYLILSMFPISNRITQIITLKVLGVPALFSSLLWAGIVIFLPEIIQKHQAYKRRTRIYKEKLKDAAAKEIVKAEHGI